MAAPMTPAAPTRSQQILAKENAIKNRLNNANTKNKLKATADVSRDINNLIKKHKNGAVTKSYQTQSILGASRGFSKSDYGVGQGAGIPYQIGTTTHKVTQSTKPKKMTPHYTPGPGSQQKMTPHYTPPPKQEQYSNQGQAEARAKVLQRQFKIDAIKRRAAATNNSNDNVTPVKVKR